MDGNELRLLLKASNEIFLAKGNYKGPVNEENLQLILHLHHWLLQKNIKKGGKKLQK